MHNTRSLPQPCTASPAVTLDPAVVAVGRSGYADVHEHLATLSHFDPDDNPLEFARVWQEIHAADAATTRGES